MGSMWSEVPEDVLRLIANCLVTLKDQVRFGCVCTLWRSILPTIHRSHPWCLLYREDANEIHEKFLCSHPWCLLYREDADEIHEKFLCLHERKVHDVEFIPEVLGSSRFLGCLHSWLVSTNDFSPIISLYNPFTKVLIALPPRYNFPNVRKHYQGTLDEFAHFENNDGQTTEDEIHPLYEVEVYDNDGQTKVEVIIANLVHRCFINKLVPSSTPTKPNCMVAAIYGFKSQKLAYCKLGDERWTCIDKGMMRYDDVIFYEQNFVYTVTFTSHMHIFDLSCNNSPKLVDTIQPPTPQHQPSPRRHSYLVKTSIGLLLVHRYWVWTGSLEKGNYRQQTKIFNLYMYKPRSRSWSKVENIGENVLFLGLNTSVSIPSSCLRGYKGNHIYFIDSFIVCSMDGARQGPYEIGVYNLDGTSVQCLQSYDSEKDLCPTLIWYIHSPQDFFDEH